uniref:Biogenesis of lysosome-related organelles complex 1 subunit 6 n=1 Tax=Timema genevievae TaxID=629358 RepID=A0A7R9PMK6_TIMGE|nr:unnamed protein product [Timema genevievae]
MIYSAGMSESREVTPVSKEEIDKLAAAWLSTLQPTLVGLQHKIVQLIDKQSAIADDLEKQNSLVSHVTDNVSLQGLSEQLSTLDERLFKIMKEMTAINARAKILTRDAMELQQIRRREALLRESKKERELQREQGLIAKPASLTSLITKDN